VGFSEVEVGVGVEVGVEVEVGVGVGVGVGVEVEVEVGSGRVEVAPRKSETRVTTSTALPGSLVVVTSPDYCVAVRGAAAPLVPWAGALAAGLCALGCGAGEGVIGAVVGTAPFTPFFCFVDDMGIRGTADRSPGYRLRVFRIRPRS
jgi:hypothetical protein